MFEAELSCVEEAVSSLLHRYAIHSYLRDILMTLLWHEGDDDGGALPKLKISCFQVEVACFEEY